MYTYSKEISIDECGANHFWLISNSMINGYIIFLFSIYIFLFFIGVEKNANKTNRIEWYK